MRMYQLSPRLAAAAAFVRQGNRAVDVGCDHGYLAAWLVVSNSCPQVIATDINTKPLEKAKELFKRLGIDDRCRALQTFGLDGIDPVMADDVIIAGLGGDAIIEIINRALWLKNSQKRLILCPTTRASRLRRWLYAQGFYLVSETAVIDGHFCYSVMHVAFCGRSCILAPGQAEIGILQPNSDASKMYIERERKRAQRLFDSGASEEKRLVAQQTLKFIDKVCER